MKIAIGIILSLLVGSACSKPQKKVATQTPQIDSAANLGQGTISDSQAAIDLAKNNPAEPIAAQITPPPADIDRAVTIKSDPLVHQADARANVHRSLATIHMSTAECLRTGKGISECDARMQTQCNRADIPLSLCRLAATEDKRSKTK